MMGGLSIWHLLIFAGIAMLFLKPTRISEMGRAVGEFKRNFKKGLHGDTDIDITDSVRQIRDEANSSREDS